MKISGTFADNNKKLDRQINGDGLGTPVDKFDCAIVKLDERPILSGTEEKYATDTFVIHYTSSGRDATSLNWVEHIAEALQLSIDTQVNDLGWALPPEDCGEGGDTRLDVYVMDMSQLGALGVAIPENIVGDNPNTKGREYYAAYSYLMIDNDMESAPEKQRLGLMQVTVAHEVHHVIQFGYDMNDPFFALYEAGATWIETIVYPQLSSAGSDATYLFNEPERCIGSFAGRDTGDSRIYGEWLMIDSIAQDFGTKSYQFIWKAMVEKQGLWGFYQALAELGTTPQEVIKRMAVRNLLYDYALAKSFESTVKISATINGLGYISPDGNGVQELGVNYVKIQVLDTLNMEFASKNENLTMFLVGIDETKHEAHIYDIGQSGTVDLHAYDYAYLIILNNQEHTNSDNCHYSDWMIHVSDGTAKPLTAPENEIWDASQFVVAN